MAENQMNYDPFTLKIKYAFGLLNHYLNSCTLWEAEV
jgi:hypothetical protein